MLVYPTALGFYIKIRTWFWHQVCHFVYTFFLKTQRVPHMWSLKPWFKSEAVTAQHSTWSVQLCMASSKNHFGEKFRVKHTQVSTDMHLFHTLILIRLTPWNSIVAATWLSAWAKGRYCRGKHSTEDLNFACRYLSVSPSTVNMNVLYCSVSWWFWAIC